MSSLAHRSTARNRSCLSATAESLSCTRTSRGIQSISTSGTRLPAATAEIRSPLLRQFPKLWTFGPPSDFVEMNFG
jgi:hypothetical protein